MTDRGELVMAAALDRVTTVEALLPLICECYGLAPADEDPAGVPEHYWGCPAGEFRYWCTRHPDAVAAWIEPYLNGAAAPPMPRA